MNFQASPIKLFLARVLAWPQEGEQPAFVNIHNTFVPNDLSTLRTDRNGKTTYPWTGSAHRDLGSAVNGVEYKIKSQNNRDIYFCTSTQGYAEEKVSARGFKYYKATRSQDNAVKLKALFIDIDLVDGKADKTKGYDTPQELVTALGNFLKATGLPKPTVMVSTGGGFHLYWCLQSALTLEDWMPLAYALAEATKREGLKCDHACTIDAARILRVPGTLNYKYDPPRHVKIAGTPVEYDYANEKIKACLSPYTVNVPYTFGSSGMSVLPPKTPLQGTSDLAAGIETTPPVNLDALVHECGFIAEALATGGQSFANPLWNITTLISTFSEGGRVDAHRMASGHPGYGPGETDELFDRKLFERSARNFGWPTCAAISSSGSSACGTCQHKAKGKSPLNFLPVTSKGNAAGFVAPQVQGGFSQAAQPVAPSNHTPAQPTNLVPGTGQQDPDIPDGFLRNANGVILYAHYNEDGSATWLPVSRYPMIDPWLQRDPWSLNFTTETEYGKRSQISVPTSTVGTAEMKKSLQEQGFMVLGSQKGFNHISEFFMAWITKLQSTRDAVITSVPFGWLSRNGQTRGFVYGGKLHTPTGVEVASNTDPELSRQYRPEGDVQPWLDAAKMVTAQRRPALDAILASAFAAPLVKFTGHSGLLMSVYSVESGIFKSTAMKIAQAVWGDPVKGLQGLSDTQNSVLNKLGELRSLPIYWDELKTDEDTKRFVDLTFRLSGGVEKSRMTAKVQQRTRGTWQTIMVSASNESLMDAVAFKTRATTAGLYRVFEYTVEKPAPGAPGQIDPTLAQRILGKLNENYGVVGESYAAYLGGNWTQIEQDMATLLSHITQEVSSNPDERFWIGIIGSIMLGARYANALGYTDIDETALKRFMYRTLLEMRQQRNAQPVDMRNAANVVNTLGRFLNESRARHTLVTNIIHRTRGKPPAGAIVIHGDVQKLDAIHVHIGKDDHTLRIGQSYFYDWLAQHNYPRHVFLAALKNELQASVISGRLGAGTAFANAQEYLIEIDIAGHPNLNFIDEV
jgi:hypothetical protein